MAEMRFLLNGRMERPRHVPATATLLDYLRLEAGLVGTKEGCAEGDCGACTVMLGDLFGGRMRHRAVNSCLMTVGQAHGQAVTTVEGLAAGPDGGLHPAQRALIDADGTQCGFCTPGFVMSMAAFLRSGEPADDETVHDVLAGNLCRCTGYRPIVDACRRMVDGPADGEAQDGEAQDGEAMKALDGIDLADVLESGGQRFFRPRSAPALARRLARHPDAWLLAGGTDLGLRFAKDRARPATVISLARVAEMRDIAFDREALRFGAAATYAELLPALDRAFPSFADLVRRIGSRQIRNLGTVGGNLVTASPIGDTLPCLIATGASVRLRSARGRRVLAVEEFIAGYRRTALAAGEFVESIEIPRPAGVEFRAYKVSKRFDQDISAVVMAAALRVAAGKVASVRLALGGVGPMPVRALRTEDALQGRAWTEESAGLAGEVLADEISPIDDFRASAEYRRRVSRNLLRRLLLSTTSAEPCRLEAL